MSTEAITESMITYASTLETKITEKDAEIEILKQIIETRDIRVKSLEELVKILDSNQNR